MPSLSTPTDAETVVSHRYSAGAHEVQPVLCCPVGYDPRFLTAIPDENLDRDLKKRTMVEYIGKYRRALIVFILAVSAGIVVATPPAAAATRTHATYNNSPAVNRRIPELVPGDAQQALLLVNQERTKAGCAPLPVVSKLQAPADQQSRDQAARDRIGHDGANGSTINSRLGGLGYSQWGENTAQAQSAQETVNAWLGSSSHRANMLNCAFSETGLAMAQSNSGRLYWTQTFGG